MASRALIARFRMPVRVGSGRRRPVQSAGSARSRADVAPIVLCSSGRMAPSSALRSTASRRGVAGGRRRAAGLSSAAPRSAARVRPGDQARRAARAARLRPSSSRLPRIAVSRLLKSCAMPPVSWPIASIAAPAAASWAARFSAVMSAVADQLRMKFPSASNSPRAASLPSNSRRRTTKGSPSIASPRLAFISGHACRRKYSADGRS